MVTLLVGRWAFRAFPLGDAFCITAAVAIAMLAMLTMLYYIACQKRIKIFIFLWKAMIAIEEWAESVKLSDEEDDPNMPKEYASWASAEKWRQSCIRQKDRKM